MKNAVMIQTVMELVRAALEDEGNNVSVVAMNGKTFDEDGIVRVTNQGRIIININCENNEEIDKTL
jgi:uncharacterized protein (DUF169 family)